MQAEISSIAWHEQGPRIDQMSSSGRMRVLWHLKWSPVCRHLDPVLGVRYRAVIFGNATAAFSLNPTFAPHLYDAGDLSPPTLHLARPAAGRILDAGMDEVWFWTVIKSQIKL